MASNVSRSRALRFIRFLFVGVLNTAFGYGVFALASYLGVAPGWSLGLTYIVGIVFNYYSTGKLVFATRGGDRAMFVRFVFAYFVLYVANLIALTVLLRVGFSPLLAQAGLLPICAVAAYLLLATCVFKGRHS